MGSKSEKMIAYCLAAVLLVVGVVSYVASAHQKPDELVRIMLQNSAGGVLFTHMNHASEDEYGIACTDCHHAWDEDPETSPGRCSECHEPESEDPMKSSDAFHMLCQGCHEDGGSGPVECGECHVFQ
ncbi:cytochrome c3 family protein [Desulfatiglans anilini]|uniref:cytochrome c3 family protein n=1 Tax=Desulfatiglans anilini TaxID=90728 RepID=UPI0004139CD7|nr:cytochrome c3 family protein [Desulfatiglans anilini]